MVHSGSFLTENQLLMKKIIISVFSIGLCCACSDNKEKNKAANEGKEQISTSATTESTSEDKAIVEWLVGKEWKAEEEAAPMSILQFYSNDTCGLVYGKDQWSFKKSHFVLGNGLVEWPFARVNDTVFTLYVQPTQRTFRYRFVKHL